MSAIKLNLLVLKTHSLERLRAFYTALGLTFVEEKHGGPKHFAARIGDVVLELYPLPADAGPADATTRLGLSIPDLDATLRELEAVGSSPTRGPQDTAWGRRAMLRDPDGRAVEVVQE